MIVDPLGSGTLYGTTTMGGAYNKGAVFEVTPNGSGGYNAPAIMYSFQGGTDGSSPIAGVIADSTGNLYGTTDLGGGSANCKQGCGTVFSLTPSGSGYIETVLYRFLGGQKDGQYPYGGLLMLNGLLYGTTSQGAAHNAGTVYAISPSGTNYKVIATFWHNGDGRHPLGALIADATGDLFSTTAAGGTSTRCVIDGNTGCGTVFELIPTRNPGHYKSYFYSFKGGKTDGQDPWDGLIAGPNGALYGTTAQGGTGVCGVASDVGCGTVFGLIPARNGYKESFIASFHGTLDGEHPVSGLVADNSGVLYGTTSHGGTSTNCTNGCGTVFTLTP